ncbi:hypothetical protein SDC9_180352 [bioreactor metagenome]|uniref:GP-PDE domain-containing protein n=1 Tax=bioreactor metagenome TaxID=1076179 RepID=A0A645H4C7_9ZZZZ
MQQFDLSYRFHGQCPAQRIPTLEEYFSLVQNRSFLNILEFKTAIFEYDGIEQKVIDMIRRFGLSDRIVLSSFNHYTLLRCKAIAHDLPCGILYECRIAEPQEYCKRLGMQYLHPDYRFLDDAELAKYEQAGIKTSPWTVDGDDEIQYLLRQPNIFAIMSNKPDRVLALRDGK